jgi:acyl-coenzyme A synthetase/AMP-(fatty) acid ligase
MRAPTPSVLATPALMEVPEYLNIGVSCTDAHLRTQSEQHVAMIVEDDNRGTSSICYGALADRTSRFAQLLRNLGIEAGDRVLVRLPNSIDYPTAFLGTMKRGAIAVPTSTLLTALQRINHHRHCARVGGDARRSAGRGPAAPCDHRRPAARRRAGEGGFKPAARAHAGR